MAFDTAQKYCDYAPGDPLHAPYHDREYGFPVADDRALFERLVLEINQAGLSWGLILRKRPAMVAAFAGFDIATVARFGTRDRARLLKDAGIIRNRLKVDAAIENARRIEAIQERDGSFAAWLAARHPMTKGEWVKLFKKEFVFTGGEIVGEFLKSIGFLPGAHTDECPVARKLARSRPKPPWLKAAPPGGW
ncbi:MAG: DNA-3-methyladenine glycosylase I [Gemmatimonas sp.]